MKDTFCSHCGTMFNTSGYPLKCSHCDVVTFRNPLPVAVLLVPVLDGLLVVRRANEPRKGFLSLPGGYIDVGETWQDACARELLEETSVKVSRRDIKLFRVATGVLSGHILIFGIVERVRIEDIKKLKHDAEVTEVAILRGDQLDDLAFISHIESAKIYFNGGSPFCTTPVPGPTKYAVVTVLDQTIGFWSESKNQEALVLSDGQDGQGGWTIKHPEAHLWETKEMAQAFIDEYSGHEHAGYWVEEIEDEAEFRARPDTW